MKKILAHYCSNTYLLFFVISFISITQAVTSLLHFFSSVVFSLDFIPIKQFKKIKKNKK